MLAAGYLPCDPDYPDDRLAIYLEDAHASVLLTQAEHLQRAQALVGPECRVLDVAEVRANVVEDHDNPPPERSSYDAVAYCIFTSGSTGRPKGVLLPHRSASDLLPYLEELHDLSTSIWIVLQQQLLMLLLQFIFSMQYALFKSLYGISFVVLMCRWL